MLPARTQLGCQITIGRVLKSVRPGPGPGFPPPKSKLSGSLRICDDANCYVTALHAYVGGEGGRGRKIVLCEGGNTLGRKKQPPKITLCVRASKAKCSAAIITIPIAYHQDYAIQSISEKLPSTPDRMGAAADLRGIKVYTIEFWASASWENSRCLTAWATTHELDLRHIKNGL